MKVALLTDTHLGFRKGSEIFLNSQMKFFREQFIPELKAAGIDTILHLGDFFDNRVHINSKVLNQVIELIGTDLKDFQIYILVGNHDSYFESTIEVNSVEPLSLFPHVHVIKNISQIELSGRKITAVPWIVKEEDAISQLEKLPQSDICIGHLELASFDMFKNKICEHGLSFQYFAEMFKITFSGHFHTRSVKEFGNGHKIVYMGNAYHLTRNDIGDDRGYCILDLDTLEYELVNNNVSLKYIRATYPAQLNESDVVGNNIDVYVDFQTASEEDVHNYVRRLEGFKPAFLPIQIKSINTMTYNNVTDIEIGSITDLMNEYIQALPIENKEKMIKLLMSLYEECKSEI